MASREKQTNGIKVYAGRIELFLSSSGPLTCLTTSVLDVQDDEECARDQRAQEDGEVRGERDGHVSGERDLRQGSE